MFEISTKILEIFDQNIRDLGRDVGFFDPNVWDIKRNARDIDRNLIYFNRNYWVFDQTDDLNQNVWNYDLSV